MYDELISIIIPVYNPDLDRLSKCLDSLNEIRESELIIVNDGSNEQTSTFLKDYCIIHSQCVLVSQDNNKGVSASRNKGIEMATGKWMMFCDADDCVDADILNSVILSLEEGELYYFDYQKVTTSSNSRIGLEVCDNKNEFIMKLLCYPNQYGTVWGKIYSSECLKKLRFHTEISHAEDTLFLLEVAERCESVIYRSEAFYEYHVYPNSAAKNIDNAVSDYLKTFELMKKEVESVDPNNLRYFNNFCVINCLIILVNYIYKPGIDDSSAKLNLKKMLSHPLVKESLEYYVQSEMGKTNRVAIFVLKTGNPFLCKMMVKARRY